MDNTRYVCAVDPGNDGGTILLNLDSDLNKLGQNDFIMFRSYKDKDTGNFDANKLFHQLYPLLKNISFMCIEHVHALFGASASATFGFGDAFGSARTVLNNLSALAKIQLNKTIPVITVAPKQWQHVTRQPALVVSSQVVDKTTGNPKFLKNGKPKIKIDTKATAYKCAEFYFPNVSFVPLKGKKPHDGLIDAALLAYYARVKLARTLSE